MRRKVPLAVLVAACLPGCGIFFIEVSAGAYATVGGREDLRGSYGLGLAAGFTVGDQRDPDDPVPAVRASVGGSSDGAYARLGGRDGLFTANGVQGRIDYTLDRPSSRIGLRATGLLSLGGGTVTQFADATRPGQTDAGFGMAYFAAPTVAVLNDYGWSAVHLSLGVGGMLLVPDSFETIFALGPQARVTIVLD